MIRQRRRVGPRTHLYSTALMTALYSKEMNDVDHITLRLTLELHSLLNSNFIGNLGLKLVQ